MLGGIRGVGQRHGGAAARGKSRSGSAGAVETMKPTGGACVAGTEGGGGRLGKA
jgi:hypothetical protein